MERVHRFERVQGEPVDVPRDDGRCFEGVPVSEPARNAAANGLLRFMLVAERARDARERLGALGRQRWPEAWGYDGRRGRFAGEVHVCRGNIWTRPRRRNLGAVALHGCIGRRASECRRSRLTEYDVLCNAAERKGLLLRTARCTICCAH